MYKELVVFRPYFRSLREFNTDVSLDVKLPLSWDIIPSDKLFPSVKYLEQDKDNVLKLISYVSPKTEEGYDELFDCVRHVINFNLDKERKERLLEEKIKELKKLFQEQNLDQLENLKFEELYGSKGTEGIGLSDSEGRGEDSEGTGSPQETVD